MREKKIEKKEKRKLSINGDLKIKKKNYTLATLRQIFTMKESL